MENIKTGDKDLNVLSFSLGEDEYGIDIQFIETIIEKNLPLTRVPGAPFYVEGVINLRGNVVPVLNLRAKLGFQTVEDTEETKIVVANVEDINVGIKVDRVYEVVQVNKNHIEKATGLGNENTCKYYLGLGKVNDKMIILLNVEEIIKN